MPTMSSMGYPRVCINLLTGKLQFSTSSLSFKNHYDSLGLSPKATQNDIKSAYYKLTMIYHPDKNKSEEAKHKFRKITDAYEILGSYKSRKMYDRGIRPVSGSRRMEDRDPEEVKKEDAQTRFYKSRLNRSKIVSSDGRTPIYNFDEWAKAHYGELFTQTSERRENSKRLQREKEDELLRSQQTAIGMPIILLVLFTFASVYTYRDSTSYDVNRVSRDTNDTHASSSSGINGNTNRPPNI
ncbi:dnaJ homolog subfamily C member 30, mitochondrial-like [Diprion similis]|uniref:dnaJ homolog subfamily C member 30, mitochondrial-like n=1 Tax=Diprion similis TaxID=362088 RepID=UPI001EF8B0C4|nr:dnaJ homolog subfamily C member 30, mitochondrial-like [Diprion similis]